MGFIHESDMLITFRIMRKLIFISSLPNMVLCAFVYVYCWLELVNRLIPSGILIQSSLRISLIE